MLKTVVKNCRYKTHDLSGFMLIWFNAIEIASYMYIDVLFI